MVSSRLDVLKAFGLASGMIQNVSHFRSLVRLTSANPLAWSVASRTSPEERYAVRDAGGIWQISRISRQGEYHHLQMIMIQAANDDSTSIDTVYV